MKFFITELKNRSLLIFACSFLFINLLYLYKDIIFFIILKKLIFQNNITNYLIYSNIMELFSIYLTLINFINTHFVIICLIFHCFIFISTALLNKEYLLLKNGLILLLQTYLFISWLIVELFPFFFNYFEKYQEPFMHFELKTNEFIWIFIDFLKYTQIYLISVLSFNKFNQIEFFKKTITRKLHYFFYIIILLMLGLTNDNISTILIINLLIIIYEIKLIIFILKTKLKDKIGFEPMIMFNKTVFKTVALNQLSHLS